MNSIEKLAQIFSHFPGIGQRQARRFVYYLLSRKKESIDELIASIDELKNDISVCSQCFRFFENRNKNKICNICESINRNSNIIMIVQRDVDLESVEKNGEFNGKYFVLGGSVGILEKNPEKKIRINELKKILEKELTIDENSRIKEIILGVNWNPEGENTANYIEREIKSLTEKLKIKVSRLGKGLSMGTELEYTDPDTLKNALKNRK